MRRRQRQLPADPDHWTYAEREEVIAVHRTFNETDFGRRAFEILRRDLWDIMPSVGKGDVLVDERMHLLNDGQRLAFDRIRAYLDAYDYMNMTEQERREFQQ